MNKIQNRKNKYEMISLEWDTEYFGVTSGRVNINSILNKEQKEEISNFCDNFDFCTLVNINNDSNTNHWLGTQSKAFLSDVNVQFEKKNLESSKKKEHHLIVKNYMEYNKDIVNISETSFIFSRFYNDPNLPIQKSKNIYSKWVKSSFDKKDKYFVFQSENNKITGFLLFSLNELNKNIIIELIAIDQNFKSKGIGKSLINTLEEYACEIGFCSIKVGTQFENTTAINFYQACGFEYLSSSPIFHLWNK